MYLFSVYWVMFWVLGSVLGARDGTLNKADRVPSRVEFMFYASRGFMLQ